ncbi:helix-turn-helix domain-containing protein [Streptomyces sp. DH41]|uniref:helix-turn-helix domain-containing protein n=1 Tax=Streptomyces sp. DH41 TaxID=3040125 RepID=UPI0024435072|nr:helix-turn-helix domain-containing protein [Streptomyces sp. DH41]MDG9722330.1 helix-turn-helix domain-containing protein [Streptomyces sp. DH41]
MTRSPATPLPPPKARRRLREAAGLTQAQLAERVGVTRGTVRAWESGRTTPRGRKREAYAKLLSALAPETTAGRTKPVPVVVAIGAGSAHTSEQAVDSLVLPAKPLSLREPEADAEADADADAKTETVAAAGAAAEQESGPEPRPEPMPGPVALTPVQAFDALYDFSASALVRQTFLLTGRRELARESVERAFQAAWENWPEVARDRDPVGWVRATAYEFALSPWQRFRLRHRHPEPPPADPGDRTLLNTLLRLPAPHRRTLVLYDGVGLDLPETAAETEASTPAAANRLLRAREAVADRLPELADPQVLHQRLAELASNERLRAGRPPTVRLGSERRARFWTRAAIAFTVALIGTTALTLRTSPTHYEPPVSPGETVRGVPPRVAPGALSDEQLELRQKLRDQLQDGPERLTPRLE